MALADRQQLAISAVPDEDTSVVLQVAGEIDLATADLLRAAIADAQSLWSGTVVVDLAGVSFIDSQGIRVLPTRTVMGVTVDSSSVRRRPTFAACSS